MADIEFVSNGQAEASASLRREGPYLHWAMKRVLIYYAQ
jgi:hypothetical protein